MKKSYKLTFIVILIILPIFPLITTINTQNNTTKKSVSLNNGTAEWTFMVYLDADNNLDSFGVDDLNEMELPPISSSVNIIVLFDGKNNGDTKVYKVVHDTNSNQESIVSTELNHYDFSNPQEVDMGAESTLEEFISETIEAYTAEKYALVLWDHGAGFPGICYDDTSSGSHLEASEISNVLSDPSVNIDLLCFDACLMGMIEYANEFKNYVDYIVFSEEVIPGDGYPYDLILAELISNPTQSVESFAKTIVDKYYESYRNKYFITLSYIETADLDDISTAINDLSDSLKFETLTTSGIDKIRQAYETCDHFHYYSYIDLYDFADKIYYLYQGINNTIANYADMVISQIDNSNIYTYSGRYRTSANGLSIYFPKRAEYEHEDYANFAFKSDYPNWYQFLSEYWFSGTGRLDLTFYEISNDDDGNNIPESGESFGLNITISNYGVWNAQSVQTDLNTDDSFVENISIDTPNLGDISVSKVANFTIKINDTAPLNRTLSFKLSLDYYYGTTEINDKIYFIIMLGSSFVAGGSSFENATTISPGRYNGTLPGPGSSNELYLRIKNVPIDKELIVEMTSDKGCDFDMFLYDENAKMVEGSWLAGSYDFLSYIIEKEGDYILKISNLTATEWGEWFLNIYWQDIASGVYEGKDLFSAILLTENDISNRIQGSLPGPSYFWHSCFYRIYLEAGETLKINLIGENDTDFDIWIYGPSGSYQEGAQDVIYPEVIEIKASSSGTYYIEVFPYRGKGTYSLSIDVIPAPWNADMIFIIIMIILVVIVLLAIIFPQSRQIILGILSGLAKGTSSSSSSSSGNSDSSKPTQPSSSTSSYRICPYCKARLPPSATKCPKCGKRV